jgi:flagellar biosynthesis protein FlhG
MNDQAHQLRTAMARPGKAEPLPMLAVTGGKGGIGKTSLAVNLALCLCRLGVRGLLVDYDLSLANADIRGRDELTRLSGPELERLTAGLGKLMSAYDLGVIDTPAGIGREVMSALHAVRTVLVVVTPDPTSITDAYALIKVLDAGAPGKDVRVVINLGSSHSEAVETYTRLRKVVNTHLKRDLPLLGILPRDPAVAAAVRARRPFALGPDCPALQALRSIAGRLKAERWK